MRVIAGSARSLKLKAPEGLNTRPTLDKIKETLFNCIQNDIPGCIFVDIFSGSGAIGIESLSRGARKAYFIENNRQAQKCIEDNLKFTRLNERAVLLKQDWKVALNGGIKEKADIVFLDPPYKTHAEQEVLACLANSDLIDEYSLIIIESDFEADLEKLEKLGFETVKIKKYKTNQHIFMRRSHV